VEGPGGCLPAKNPDVEVSTEVLPWANRNEKLTTSLRRRPTPTSLSQRRFHPAARRRWATSSPSMTSSRMSVTISCRTRSRISRSNGTLYAVPILTTDDLALQQDAVRPIGVTEYPATWDDMLALGPKFKEAGVFLTSSPARWNRP